MSSKKTKVVAARIPNEACHALEELSHAMGQTVSDVVRLAVIDYYQLPDNQKKKGKKAK